LGIDFILKIPYNQSTDGQVFPVFPMFFLCLTALKHKKNTLPRKPLMHERLRTSLSRKFGHDILSWFI